jgi:hypothetical protein
MSPIDGRITIAGCRSGSRDPDCTTYTVYFWAPARLQQLSKQARPNRPFMRGYGTQNSEGSSVLLGPLIQPRATSSCTVITQTTTL